MWGVLHDWISLVANHSISGVPLVFIGIFGCAGVFLDIDHFIAYYYGRGLGYRFLHPYWLILSCVIMCIGSAFIGRLLAKVFLKW
jgi:hypothetical protein